MTSLLRLSTLLTTLVASGALGGCYLSHTRALESEPDASAPRDAGAVRDLGTSVDAGVACAPGDIIARDYEQHFAQLVGASGEDGLWLVGSPRPVADLPAPMQLLRTTQVRGAAPEVSFEAEIPGSAGFQVVDAAILGSRVAILAGHPGGPVLVFVFDRVSRTVRILSVPEGAASPTYGGVALLADRLAVTASSADSDRYPYIVTTGDFAPLGTGTLSIAGTVGVRDGRLVAASYTRESSTLHLRLLEWSDTAAEFAVTDDIGLGLTIGRWGEDVYAAYGGDSLVLLTRGAREDLPRVPGAASFGGLPSVARVPGGYFVALAANTGLVVGVRSTTEWTWIELGTAGGYQVAFARDTSRGTFALSFDFSSSDNGRLLYRGLCDAR